MKLPGFNAEVSLFDAGSARYRTLSESARSLAQPASSSETPASVHPAVLYACHWKCDRDVCVRVCGPLLTV
ncbi:MAG: hypothetical protein P4L85_26665 [Paludisphaera borealis]|uniref:hypothetical protein n=1 Tax=Paludisphaera borealis TaxID=1387353 RepID=UPI002846F2F1|nr:hypothetical protein [Paludisphaera borealis]MDR3622965.1 hypothetical protein [Paludisphaera borealis]